MYLDPGSGSLIFQMILAGLLGISVFIKIFWRKIINLFKLNKKDSAIQGKVIED
jgi:hypothetical protein